MSAVDFHIYGVHEEGKQFTVNIREMKCSCHVWDHEQIPCIHACAVLRRKNFRPYQYVAEYYHTSILQATYASKVMPIRNKDQWIPDGEVEDVKDALDIQKRSASRPKNGFHLLASLRERLVPIGVALQKSWSQSENLHKPVHGHCGVPYQK